MAPMLRLVLLSLIFSQIANSTQATGKLKPDAGKEDCEWWYGGAGTMYNVWSKVWDQKCKLDDAGKPINDLRIPETNRSLDRCCTEFLGLECRPTYWDKNEGVCYKPDPYQKDRSWGPVRFLSMMKKKKIADGQQLDFMWDKVRIVPNS